MTPSPSDPDLWSPDVDIDPRDIEDEPEPDVDEDGERTCIDCDEPSEDDLCEKCERLHDATRGDLESEE